MLRSGSSTSSAARAPAATPRAGTSAATLRCTRTCGSSSATSSSSSGAARAGPRRRSARTGTGRGSSRCAAPAAPLPASTGWRRWCSRSAGRRQRSGTRCWMVTLRAAWTRSSRWRGDRLRPRSVRALPPLRPRRRPSQQPLLQRPLPPRRRPRERQQPRLRQMSRPRILSACHMRRKMEREERRQPCLRRMSRPRQQPACHRRRRMTREDRARLASAGESRRRATADGRAPTRRQQARAEAAQSRGGGGLCPSFRQRSSWTACSPGQSRHWRKSCNTFAIKQQV
mmetsp:Transcript_14461/g.41787  ORF Transcript_14461/g.41787 Transcript_14461/m.41787 type:complete len:285 (-) Transcript_14461:89-943(-)